MLTYAYRTDHDELAPILDWFLTLVSHHFDIKLEEDNINPSFTIGTDDSCDVWISSILIRLVEAEIDVVSDFKNWFDPSLPIITEANRKDYVTTIYYLVNSLQEYDHLNQHRYKTSDVLRRFSPEFSIQNHYGVHLRDLVSEYLWTLFSEIIPKKDMTELVILDRIHIGFDIDFVRPSILQSLTHAFRALDLSKVIKILRHEYEVDTHLAAFDQIILWSDRVRNPVKVFWLPERGKSSYKNLHNSDYNIDDSGIKSAMNSFGEKGIQQGLHKSLEKTSHIMEASMLPFTVQSNRQHFLNFSLPELYQQIERSAFAMDTSLGWYDQLGYRNSYSRPFVPYDHARQKAYSFVEHPFSVMDIALQRQKEPLEKFKTLLSRLTPYSDLNILWHNSTFWDKTEKSLSLDYLFSLCTESDS